MGEINVIEKRPGNHIPYEVDGKKIVFGHDEISINLESRERDFEVLLDICIDSENGIVIGTGGKARKYAAQIIIPARRYDTVKKEKGESEEAREEKIPVDFDTSNCTLILWEV